MLRTHYLSIFQFLLSIFLLTACNSQPPPTPLPSPTPEIKPTDAPPPPPTPVEGENLGPLVDDLATTTDGVVIGEVLLGDDGANSREFIELYNAGVTAVTLDGWALYYRLADNQDEILLYRWDTPHDIPPHGHYLLVQEGQEFGTLPDATYNTPLFQGKGGLQLRDATGQPIDSLGWGDAPLTFVEGGAAAAPPPGQTLERLPAGPGGGHAVDSNDNRADFIIATLPSPQNSGTPPVPPLDIPLSVNVVAPGAIPPGTAFSFEVAVRNNGETRLEDVQLLLPVGTLFTITALPEEALVDDGRLLWTIPFLTPGETATAVIALESPFTYGTTVIRDYYAATADGRRAYGPPTVVAISGGSVPIGVARDLPLGSVVTVEGIATMYTGGFFAGSSSTKFYVEDETGGIQVFADGLRDQVEVNIGDRVRATGHLELFRDTLEVIPASAADVVVVERGAAEWPPTPITIVANESDPALIGRLNVAEGTILAIVEQSFSWEITLADDAGNTTLVLIEKDTGVTAEPLDVGQRYRVIGITEFVSNDIQLKPRLQSDIRPLFPPVLAVAQQAPNSVISGDFMTYTIAVVNHTPDTLTNLVVVATPPGAATLVGASEGADIEPSTIVWNIAALPGNGEAVVLEYIVEVTAAAGILAAPPVTAVADQWTSPAESAPYLTFVGTGVPIWAIQGDGFRSPYVRGEAITEGVVTGVFPDLDGFFIQSTAPDDDPTTSEGVFVRLDLPRLPVAPGDLVRVNGRVREVAGQTTLDPGSPANIEILASEQPLPAAVPLDPPLDEAEALVYFEAREGMLVGLTDTAVAVGPTTRFGEYTVVYERWGVDRVARTDPQGYFIFVDDGSTVAHDDQSTLPYAVTRGDRIDNLVGPLAYTFGNYKILPLAPPAITAVDRPLPALPLVGDDQFAVATLNVENLYDLVDPHPSSPPRPSLAEYRLRLDKIANTIIALGAPDVIGLQEVENISILEDVVALPQLADFGYVPYLIEGEDSRGIDVAYLVRAARVRVIDVAAYPGPNDLTSRHPLALTIAVPFGDEEQTIVLLNNHFLSLSAGVEATEPTRTAQAQWNVDLMQQLLQNHPGAVFVVMGDLNSFYETLPIVTLEVGGVSHVYRWLPPEDAPYTYIFEGATQTLDHILVSPFLFERLTAVTALHVNADFPIPDPADPSPRRLSDHDPLIAVFDRSQ